MEHENRVESTGVDSFTEFARNELKIVNPDTGLMKFELFDYQKGLVQVYENERFVIIRKFRNCGYTTTTLAYLFWKCLTVPETKVGVFSCSTAQAVNCMRVVRRFIANLSDNCLIAFDFGDSDIKFSNGSTMLFRNATCDTGSDMKFDYVLFDEAAYNYDAENVWKALYPCLMDNGKAFVVSSVNGKVNIYRCSRNPNWFYNTYRDAFINKNDFVTYDVDYTNNPKYGDPEYVKQLHETLGDPTFREEVLCQFLSVKESEPPLSCGLYLDVVVNEEFHDSRKREYENGGDEKSFVEIPNVRATEVPKNPISKELGKELEKLAGVQETTHPEFPKEPDWNLAELWEDIAEHIPAYKGVARDMRKSCEKQHMEDISVIRDPSCRDVALFGLECNGEPKVVTFQTKLIDKIMEGESLPKEMEITISDRAVEINGVPTQIFGNAVEYLFKGYIGLTDEETAINETARIVRARLQKLF